MNTLEDLVIQAIDNTFREVIEQDEEYRNLNNKKDTLLLDLEDHLSGSDMEIIRALVGCLEKQIFITAMGFSFVRVLDIHKKKQLHGSLE